MQTSKLIAALVALTLCVAVTAERQKLNKERIVEWHDKLYESTNFMNAPGGGSSGLRGWSMMTLAMFDAVNIIENNFNSYYVKRADIPSSIDYRNADTLAAAAKAAQVVLDSLFPLAARRYAHLAQLAIHIGGLPQNSKTSNGLLLGEFVGTRIIAKRSTDGHPPANPAVVNGTNFDEYIYGTPYFPGVPNSPGYPSVLPFAIPSYTDSRFTVVPPLSRDSAQWLTEWAELYTFGTSNASASARTNETDNIARFHDGNFGSQIGWTIDVLMSADIDLDADELLRIIALTAMSSHDAHATHWYYKYFYLLGRPIVQYRNVPQSKPDLYQYRDNNWSPALTTSQTPEYPSGHASRTGGVTHSFTRAFGDQVPGGSFRTISFTQPQLGFRTYTTFSGFQSELMASRTYGGVHWRASGHAGSSMALRVTNYIWDNFLTEK